MLTVDVKRATRGRDLEARKTGGGTGCSEVQRWNQSPLYTALEQEKEPKDCHVQHISQDHARVQLERMDTQ